jgi:mRNA interferase MazF
MKRGEVWTLSGGPGYAGKPRPAVVLQDDRFKTVDSITLCAFTTDTTEAPLFRLAVVPTDANGLKRESRLMVDKIITVPRTKLGHRIGRLADEDMIRLNRYVLVFLGLAGPQ